MKQHLCVDTALFHELVNTGFNGGKQRFSLSLLVLSLTVKKLFEQRGPAQEETRRSIVLALRSL